MRVLLILLMFVSAAYSAELPQKNIPIEIRSVSARFDQDSNKATFIKNVVFRRGGLTVKSNKLVIYRNKSGVVVRAVATGSVHIKNIDKKKQFTASSESAVYSKKDQTLILTGGPVKFNDGTNKGEGEKLVYHIDTKNSELFSDKHPITLIVIPKKAK